MPLPIGFFMPLPLPIMIPFMMWQSAAIAAGFGTYFQFAKRRVSAMSNEEFNKSDPHELVNSMYNDIVQQIPSSFAKVDSLTPVMLQSMNVMLDQAVKWLQGAITGNFFGTPNTFDTTTPTEDTTPAVEDHIPISAHNVSSWSISALTSAIAKIRDHPHDNHFDAVTTANIEKFFKEKKKKLNFEPGIDLETIVVLTNFKKSDYPLTHQLILTKLNSATNRLQFAQFINPLIGDLNKKIREMSQSTAFKTQRLALIARRQELYDMVVIANKTLPN